jgi:sensor histidine kinase YesM
MGVFYSYFVYFIFLFLFKINFLNIPFITLRRNSITAILSLEHSINLAFPFWFLKNYTKNIKQKLIIEEHLNNLRKLVFTSQLIGLKNQINPHFFYNTLNFLYAQSLSFTPKLSKEILKLSEMMRYAIRDNDGSKVDLDEEVNYLKNYIQLENLSHDNNFSSILEIMGNIKYRRISPLSFQPILEISYKYGNYVKFLLNIEENCIKFSSKLKIKEGIDLSTLIENIESSNTNNNSKIILKPSSDEKYYYLFLYLKS